MGLVDRRATILFPGGPLELEWADDDHVYLTGPATFVFDGDHAPDFAMVLKTEFGART
jgi:diaminopimelate epimerase